MRVGVASSCWSGRSVEHVWMLALGQVEHWKWFIYDILLNIQLGWSRCRNEVLRHVENWSLARLGKAGSLFERRVMDSTE